MNTSTTNSVPNNSFPNNTDNNTNNNTNNNSINNTINNTNRNCVILERHYIPYHLYREMYNYPQHQYMFNNNYYDSNQPNSLFTNSNPINYRYNLFNSIPNSNTMNMNTNTMNANTMNTNTMNTNNEPINIRRPIIPTPIPYTFPTEPVFPINQNNLYTIPTHTPTHTQTTNSTSHNNNVFRHNYTSDIPINSTSNLNINTILNDVINDISTISDIPTIPYNFEINNGFGTIGQGYVGTITSTMNNNFTQEEGIPLSNINLITNVSRYCDILNNTTNDETNNNNETCSICQLTFIDTSICRVIHNCNHIFHINCIDTWLYNHTTCPFCRYDLLNITISNDINNDENENNDIEETEEGGEDYEDDEEGEEDYEEGENVENTTQSQSNNTTNNTTEPIINTEPILHDINTFVSMSTPFINNFIHQRIPNSNASPRINSEQINRQINNSVNQFVSQLNPLLQSFNNFGNRN